MRRRVMSAEQSQFAMERATAVGIAATAWDAVESCRFKLQQFTY